MSWAIRIPKFSSAAMRDDALILLVEDRADDVTLVIRSFDRAGIKNPIRVVPDGEQALAYLNGSGSYSDRQAHPLPELILLDLKMPKVDGFEVLRWIRTHPHLSRLRVVVLTSSDNIRDVNLAYNCGANSFLVKPMDFNHFVELSAFIADHWFMWSKAPTSEPAPPNSGAPWPAKNKRVLLRGKGTRKFYSAPSVWGDKHDALDFERIELAEAVAAAEHLRDVEIVLAYEQPGCDLTLPIAVPGLRRT